jgi:predicted Zn-dependent protease with MMP-like domain
MSLEVNRSLIIEKLDYLHCHPSVQQKPTAEPIYKLPRAIYREIIGSDFSGESIQKLSNHIGHFLGLFRSVKVTIGIESSEYMLATVSTTDDTDKVGLYKVKCGGRREIQLTKKFRFKFNHIMAILVHESMHNYLDNLVIRINNAEHNEILTDVSAAYFGLGHHIIRGYKPIEWTTERAGELGLTTITTTHSITIGYVPSVLIEYAVYRTAVIRDLPEFVRICPPRFWIPMGFRLLFLRHRKRADSRRFMTLEKRLVSSKKRLSDIEKILLSPSEHHWKERKGKNANTLVELHGIVATGEIQRSFDIVMEHLRDIAESGHNDVPPDLLAEANDLTNRIEAWDRAIKKELID